MKKTSRAVSSVSPRREEKRHTQLAVRAQISTDSPPVSLDHCSKHGVQLGLESNADYVQDLPCFGRTNLIQPWAHLWWSKLPKRCVVRDKVSLHRIKWKLGYNTRRFSVDGCPQKEDHTAQKEDKESTQAAQEQNRHRDMCNLRKSQA